MSNITFKYQDNSESSSKIVAVIDNRTAGEISLVKTGEKMLIIDSTNVNDDFRGMNIGGQLVEQVVILARKESKKIIPLCLFQKRVQ